MGRTNSAMQYLATTGAGIAVGVNGIQFASVWRSSDLAGTVILKDSGTTVLTMSADRSLSLAIPVCLRGPVTMTSSGGVSFVIGFRDV